MKASNYDLRKTFAAKVSKRERKSNIGAHKESKSEDERKRDNIIGKQIKCK